jgi:GTP-binding protein
MFTDKVEIFVTSGNGGAGCVAFRREKFVTKGGPNGGDGGKGGDVYFEVDNNSHTLAGFKGNKHLKAENGRPGEGSRCTGKSGQDLIVKVPPGTQISDLETGEVLIDMLNHGDKKKFLSGGKGGLGNFHFKSSSNQKPMYAQPGIKGVQKSLVLELKLIADVGLVGFPNVGKSTLISTVSNARPEVANYEFTTLTPKLGEVPVSEYESFVMADIPGIIGGASEGKGLGHAFLRHIERTGVLLFMIDLGNYRTLMEQYETLKEELKNFSQTLSTQKFAIALTRTDLFQDEDLQVMIDDFITEIGLTASKTSRFGFDKALPFYERSEDDYTSDNTQPYFVAPISSVMQRNEKALCFALYNIVVERRNETKA